MADVKSGDIVVPGDQLCVIEELMAHNNMMIGQARSYLARYLFSEDDVFKPVKALSGGERGRLALAKLALSDANLLLLDEPTNHLDIPAQEVLQNVMADFEGDSGVLFSLGGNAVLELLADGAQQTIFRGTCFDPFQGFEVFD